MIRRFHSASRAGSLKRPRPCPRRRGPRSHSSRRRCPRHRVWIRRPVHRRAAPARFDESLLIRVTDLDACRLASSSDSRRRAVKSGRARPHPPIPSRPVEEPSNTEVADARSDARTSRSVGRAPQHKTFTRDWRRNSRRRSARRRSSYAAEFPCRRFRDHALDQPALTRVTQLSEEQWVHYGERRAPS